MHWTDGYYGELYLESIEDLLTPALTALEAGVIGRLLALGPGRRVLDLACGHGRHALALAGHGATVIGLDRSGPYLRRATAAAGAPGRPGFVQADLRALPFGAAAFDAVYSWYASLFMYDEPGNASALLELARVLRRGGRALVQHGNPLRLAADPAATARRVLGDGSVVEEVARFDPAAGVEHARRRLTRPGGAVLEGTASLRYYGPDEWGPLARGAGLELEGVTSTTGVAGPEAPDLIAVLGKR